MVNAVKHKHKINYDKVKEANTELEHLKWNWNFNKCCSGRLEIPENILDLEGVEYLLKLNIFNEVPKVMQIVAGKLIDYNIISKASDYSEAKFKEYKAKATELIERMLGLFEELGVDLATITDVEQDYLYISHKWFITTLASKIGKSEEYSFNKGAEAID